MELPNVIVHFFKESGKWYATEYIPWTGTDEYLPLSMAQTLINYLKDKNGDIRFREMIAVCLAPKHKNAHPQMMTVKQAIALTE